MKIIFLVLLLTFSYSTCIADSYVLVMSKDNNLCQHMLKLYNEDLRKYGKIKYKNHMEFNWIKWKKKEIILRPTGVPIQCEDCTINIDAKIALFDINNDSKDEAIIYSKGMLSNHPTDDFDILRIDDLSLLDEIIDGKIYYSKVLKSLSSNDGSPQNVNDISDEGLKKIPKRMRFFVDSAKARGDKYEYFIGGKKRISFLKYNERFYIEFEGPRGIGPDEEYTSVEHYGILSEYKQDNTLNNQCLYLIKTNQLNKRRAK